MSSVLNQGGLYSQGGNRLGNLVRGLQNDVADLRKQVAVLKAGASAAGGSQQVVMGPPGPAGPAGPQGPPGPKGEPGQMAYVALPPQFMGAGASAAPAAVAPVAAPAAAESS